MFQIYLYYIHVLTSAWIRYNLAPKPIYTYGSIRACFFNPVLKTLNTEAISPFWQKPFYSHRIRDPWFEACLSPKCHISCSLQSFLYVLGSNLHRSTAILTGRAVRVWDGRFRSSPQSHVWNKPRPFLSNTNVTEEHYLLSLQRR